MDQMSLPGKYNNNYNYNNKKAIIIIKPWFFGSILRCLVSHLHLEPQAVPIYQVKWRERSFHRSGVMLRSHTKNNSLNIVHHLQLVCIYVFSMSARWVGRIPWTLLENLRYLQDKRLKHCDTSKFSWLKNLNKNPSNEKKKDKLISMSTCDFHG